MIMNMLRMNRMMENGWKYIMMLWLPVWLLAACSDKETVVEPSITLSGSEEILMSKEAGTTHVSFTSAREWTVSSSQSWCRVSPTSGLAGSASVTVNVTENTTYDDREATLVIRSETLTKTVTLTQKQCDAIVVAKSAYLVDDEETELNFDVSANVELEVKCSVDWIKKVEAGRALLGHSLSFVVEKNESTEDREGVISITGGDQKQDIKVTQYGKPDYGKVVVVHSNPNFMVPLVTGRKLKGEVFWGDGSREDYAEGLVHTYGEQKQYSTTIEVYGADVVTLQNLVDVAEIDFSEF